MGYINYGNKHHDTMPKRLFKGLAYYIAGTLINTWFVTVMTALSMKALIIKLFVGIAALFILDGLFFNYAVNAAKSDNDNIKYHSGKEDKFMSLKMALFAPLPAYIMYILLVLAKAGVFGNSALGVNGFNYYMLWNLYTVPWIGLITDGRTMETLNIWGLLGLLALLLTMPLTIIISYEFTRRDIDISERLVYGKKHE